MIYHVLNIKPKILKLKMLRIFTYKIIFVILMNFWKNGYIIDFNIKIFLG